MTVAERAERPPRQPPPARQAVPRAAIVAAVLAAVAEGGVLFLPVRALALETVKVRAGPFENYLLFVAVFAVAVAVVTSSPGRTAPAWVAGGAAAIGILQALAAGRRTPGSVALAAVLALAVGIRVVGLGLRDWRNPITGSFGWGAGVLLLEVLFASSVQAGWEPVIPLIVPVFFVASLASRAASIRFASGPVVQVEGSRWMGGKLWALMIGGLAAMMALGAALGYDGGPLQALGRLVSPVFRGIVVVVAAIMGQVIRPFAFLASKLNVDPAVWRRFFQRLRLGGLRGRRVPVAPAHPGVTQRLFGLVLLLTVALFLAWVIQRYRNRLRHHTRTATKEERVVVTPLPSVRERISEAVRVRRELPEDTIRRWYAEALIELERKGLPKPGWATPAEYLVDVGAAFPSTASGFVVLTRAYEDVRYGDRRFDRRMIQQIEPHREFVMDALRQAKRLPPKKASPEAEEESA